MKKLFLTFLAPALVAPVLLMPSAQASSDAYDPLFVQTGGQGNVIEYVVEDGTAEGNAYIAIMPGQVTSSTQSH